MEFLEHHKNVLANDVRACVAKAAGNAEDACNSKDPDAIREVTDELCEATACAIRAVYPA
jgi:hypothetical protein